MKMQELKAEVFKMAGVESLKEFKQKYEEYDNYYFNKKAAWEELYEIFQERNQEEEVTPSEPKVETGIRKPEEIPLSDAMVEKLNKMGEAHQESYTSKGQIDLPKREEELTPHLILNFQPAAQRIAKQGKAREGMLISRRIKSDKSKGFGQHVE